MVRYNYLPELTRLRSRTAGICLRKQDNAFIALHLHKKCIVYENYYLQWLFLVIFYASLSGIDDFVIFDSLDVNAAFCYLGLTGWKHCFICKCSMPIFQFCIKGKIRNLYGWKHCYCGVNKINLELHCFSCFCLITFLFISEKKT